MKNLFCLIVLIFASLSFAAETKIVNVTHNDENDPHFYLMILETNKDGEITRLHKDLYNKVTGKVTKRETFKRNLIFDGVVLDRRRGFDVLKLSGPNMDFNYGGALVLDYLVHALRGKYSQMNLNVEKIDDQWVLTDQQGERVINIDIKVKRQFPVGVVGIDQVILKY